MLSHGHRYLGRDSDHMQSCMGTHAWLMRTRLVSCILNTALKLEAELWEMNRSDSWAAYCPPPQGSLRHVIACIVSFSVTLAFPLPQKHHMVPDTKWPQWTYPLLLVIMTEYRPVDRVQNLVVSHNPFQKIPGKLPVNMKGFLHVRI